MHSIRTEIGRTSIGTFAENKPNASRMWLLLVVTEKYRARSRYFLRVCKALSGRPPHFFPRMPPEYFEKFSLKKGNFSRFCRPWRKMCVCGHSHSRRADPGEVDFRESVGQGREIADLVVLRISNNWRNSFDQWRVVHHSILNGAWCAWLPNNWWHSTATSRSRP